MAHIISIVNQKGGVGKTTTTINIGVGLVKAGNKVLLIDLDPQADLSKCSGFNLDLNTSPLIQDLMKFFYMNHIPYCTFENSNDLSLSLLDIEEEQVLSTEEIKEFMKLTIQTNPEGYDYIPASVVLSSTEIMLVNATSREFILKNIVSYIEKDYDYILIDCPPSLGLLVINALTASQYILVPVQAQSLALDALVQLIKNYQHIRKTTNPHLQIIGILLTMVNPTTNMSKKVSEALRDKFKNLTFETSISMSTKAPDSNDEQKSLFAFKEKKLSQQYLNVTKEIDKRINKAL